MTRPNDIASELWTEWEETFEKIKSSGEQALLLAMAPTREPFFKELWVVGCWLGCEMEKLGATDEEITSAQFVNGQIATTVVDAEGLWKVALNVFERHKSGNPYTPGDKLAEELAPGTISNMTDEELAAHATEIAGEEIDPDTMAKARAAAEKFGFGFSVGDEVVVPKKDDYN